jgi:hypothetical protein
MDAAKQKIPQIATDAVIYPNSFDVGTKIGVANAGAKIITSIPKLAASAQSTGTRIIGEAVNVDDSAIDASIAANPDIQALRMPDQGREYLHEAVINNLAALGLNERALRNGSLSGEIGFNVAMLALAVYDLPASIEEIAEAVGTLGSRLFGGTEDLASAINIAGETRGMDTFDFAPTGQYGGRVLTPKQLDALKTNLARQDIDLITNAEIPANAAFTPALPQTGRPTMLLRSDATTSQVTHEWLHTMDYLDDPAGYLLRPRVVREQIVFDGMAQPGVWNMLTIDERRHYIWAIEEYYGGTARGLSAEAGQ